MPEATERESMEFDVIIVGGGPAGLSAACRLMQLNSELSVAVVEKGSEIGAHILSGNVFEPFALNELFPNWQNMGAPINTAVDSDQVQFLIDEKKAMPIPSLFLPKQMKNHGNFIISLGQLCRWLGDQAENMGVNVLPGFAAAEVLYEDDRVVGVATSDMGIDKQGEKKTTFQSGYELIAKYVIFAEGVRGNLSEQVIEKFNLRENSDPQHYGIGIKEIWEVDDQLHREGLVIHTLGWPLNLQTEGGGFLYHAANKKVFAGLIVGLNYKNPSLSPFEEFQRWKKHPKIRCYLESGKRIAYGARAVNKGGLQSLPKLTFPGGMLIGCAAGFLNGVKIKGSHTAIKTGMLAAERIHKEFSKNCAASPQLKSFENDVKTSWVYKELYCSRNFNPAMQKFGTFWGAVFTFVDQNIFSGRLPFTLHNKNFDHKSLNKISKVKVIDYPKPDGKITFDRLSSVFLSNTNHEEDQPSHLVLKNDSIPISYNLPEFGEPAQLYCPAGVYEIIDDGKCKKLQINAINCVHCKTCDIKDPKQNIVWKVPEGGGGPNYSNM